jgi:hypothetical protein
MPVPKKISRNNLKLNLKLRAISRRMESLLNRTRSGKLCLHLWDVFNIADEVSLLCHMDRDAEHYAAADEFVGAFDTTVIDHIADREPIDRNDHPCMSPYAFNKDGGESRTWEGSIADLATYCSEVLHAKSAKDAEALERRFLFGLINVSEAFDLGEDGDFIKRLGKETEVR